MVELTRGKGTALHAQLTAILAEIIRSGTYPTGASLPSESDLQATYGVARSVVRQALGSLVSMGLIERVKGSGSRVIRSTRYHRLAQSGVGLAAQLLRAGAQPSTSVLTFERHNDRAEGFAEEATGSLLLERLRVVDAQPVAFIVTWLPLPLVASLTAHELIDTSLHEIMRHRYGTTFAGGPRQVRAVAASEKLAGLLDVHQGAPLLLLEGLTRDNGGRVVEKFATWHRADLISLDYVI
jgi:GntR family transcriptional regulator